MTKQKGRFDSITDERGVEWQTQANDAWKEAEALAAESGRHPLDHYRGYIDRGKTGRAKETAVAGLAPDLPDFGAEASQAVAGEVLGRFLYVPEDRSVHDTTKAKKECRVDRVPRVFIHFAHEIEGAVPEDAVPCSACMA